ncbi:ABC transporter permease [Plantactinospora sp. GCM10030261]|uniref:ABC transporter permease n=1 Tax=Plantactinospora sp. GCM10030261 TaxID=3273420 RepID=UPI00362236C9
MNLVRAEAHRLASRGFVRLMVALLLAAFGVTIATTLAGSHQPTQEEVLTAQREADDAFYTMQRYYSDCLERQRFDAPPEDPAVAPPDCERVRPVRPSLATYLAGVFVFEREIKPLSYFLIAFLVLFGFLVGASAVGAELTSGGMTNMLLWRPERMTVLGVKLGTVLGATLAVSVAATVGYVGIFRLIAEVAGLPGRLGGEFWGGLLLMLARGLVLVLLATATGFAIATLGRHTAAALGVVAAYGVIWEAGARIVMEISQTTRSDLWMLSTHIAAWLRGRLELWDLSGCSGFACSPMYTLTATQSFIVLLAVTGGCVGAAFAAFRRRDLA